MRVGFAGTTGFAARALAAIAAAGHTIPVVLTRPDKPKGRGMKVDASPVKALAESLGLPLLQPFTLKDEAARLYKEVAENNFNTVDFALLRAPALKKVG